MKRVVYILSEEHCGSTLLSMQLGRHPDVFSAGELDRFLIQSHLERRIGSGRRTQCSCGAPLDACDFWAPVMQRFMSDGGSSLSMRLSWLLGYIGRFHGSDKVLVDASKNLSSAKALLSEAAGAGITPEQLLIVHLFRDPRGSAASAAARGKDTALAAIRHMRLWKWRNAEFRRFSSEAGCDSIRVSYEDLCFSPDQAMERLHKAIGVEHSPDWRSWPIAMHLGTGNRVRTQKGRREAIAYDQRWFESGKIQALYWLVPGVRALNRELKGLDQP